MNSKSINFKKTIYTSVDDAIQKVTAALQTQGFGILTRIDFHLKIKEKLGKEIKPVIILGACNPQLAYDAYQKNTDITSLLPCNAVIRDLGQGQVSIELAKPSGMMEMLGETELAVLAKGADDCFIKILEQI